MKLELESIVDMPTFHSRNSEVKKIWRAFYMKPRHEKKASDRLELKGFETYCPVVDTKVRWSDRWKRVKKPLFNGYLFARLTENERLLFLEDSSVVRTVTWLGKPAVILDTEIEAIRKMMGEAVDVKIEPLHEGDLARVDSGVLHNLYGTVVTVTGGRARLRLEMLNSDLVFSVRASQLKKISQS